MATVTVKQREPTEEERSKIYDAAKAGDVNAIQSLAENGVDVTGVVDPYRDNETALHRAAYYGHYSVVAYLLSHGARVNDVHRDHWTALQRAAEGGHYDVVVYLLSHGARIKINKLQGYSTALHRAAERGHYDVVVYLLSHGAGVNDFDGRNCTALHLAARNGHYNVVVYLLSHGARVNDVDRDNKTALHRAAADGRYDVVAYLLSHGARVNDIDGEQWTPLHYAAINGYADTLDLLVKNGASISMKTSENETPLKLAVEGALTIGESCDAVYYLVKQLKMDITEFDHETQQKIDELVETGEQKKVLLDCFNAESNVKNNYNELAHLSIDSMLTKLFAKDVITSEEKETIEKTLPWKKMKYFLDNIITPSLIYNTVKFKAFLEVMEQSGDPLLINMANKLGVSKDPPAQR